jgi:chemotaxis methyl-accepting protein methylase
MKTKAAGGYRSNAQLAEVVERVRKAHGLDLYPYDGNFLANSLDRRMTATSIPTLPAYVELLGHDPAEAETLFRSLNVVYSEFFRNSLAFSLLEHLILPGLLDALEKSGRSEIRIWSAGCATGQEAWSVAILVAELAGRDGKPLPSRIIASDVSAFDLAKARSGIYSPEAMGNIRLKHVQNYFTRQGDVHTIVDRLKERVEFVVHDLLDEGTIYPPESIFGDFDLVLCSNVLMYYRPEMQRLILGKILRSLTEGGILLTDGTERQIVENIGGFHRIAAPAAVFRKN